MLHVVLGGLPSSSLCDSAQAFPLCPASTRRLMAYVLDLGLRCRLAGPLWPTKACGVVRLSVASRTEYHPVAPCYYASLVS